MGTGGAGSSLGCRTMERLVLGRSLLPEAHNLSILAEPECLKGACQCEDVPACGLGMALGAAACCLMSPYSDQGWSNL